MHVVLCRRQLFYIKCMNSSYCTLIIRLFWLVICTILFQLPFCYCSPLLQFVFVCGCTLIVMSKLFFVAQNEWFSNQKIKDILKNGHKRQSTLKWKLEDRYSSKIAYFKVICESICSLAMVSMFNLHQVGLFVHKLFPSTTCPVLHKLHTTS